MGNTKKSLIVKLSGIVIFSYLVVFPLGQIIRLSFNVAGNQITLHPVDIIAGAALALFLLGKLKQPRVFRFILGFLAVSAFSLLFSLTIFETSQVFVGAFYLLRFFAYAGFFALSWNYSNILKQKSTLLNSLILVSLMTAVIGWIQYLWIPDLRDLKFLGWDDHLFRLTGSFLDPAFTSIILVLGFLAILGRILDSKNKRLAILGLFLIVTLGFTYSRAAFLALTGGVFIFIIIKKKFKLALWSVLVLIFLLPFLPRQAGEGVRLERIQSVINKRANYRETLAVYRKSPLLGIGFNNICASRIKYFTNQDRQSHACSGSDSSLLLVLATTGAVGLMIFLNMAIGVAKSVDKGIYGLVFKTSCGALFVHSIFVNSLFYPWIMGWMGILLAISLKEKLR